MTVPIYTDRSGVDISSDTESLCYEVHGEADAYFNLISDECTSVSAYYEAVVTPNVGINLNVMTRIGVRATGSSRCWNIRVDLDNCTTTVRGTGLSGTTTVGGGTSFDGIAVRTYPLSSRVRISVPNCADTMLVMWVFCKTGRVRDPDTTGVYYDIRFIRFVVMRGLNLNEQSHGLIGMTSVYSPQFPTLFLNLLKQRLRDKVCVCAVCVCVLSKRNPLFLHSTHTYIHTLSLSQSLLH